jgi:hypothetical protein
MDQRERFIEYWVRELPPGRYKVSAVQAAHEGLNGSSHDAPTIHAAWDAWQAAEAAALERAAQVCDENARKLLSLEVSNAPTALTITAMDIRKLAAPVERGGE